MIVIVGDTHDDILYFDSILLNKKKEMLLSRFDVSIGTIFNQDVLVVHELFSSVLASAVLTHILGLYNVDLVITVGRCISASKAIKNGDVVISNQIIDANVDLSLFNDVVLGQYPGFSREFIVQKDVIKYLEKGINRRSYISHHNVTILTSDNLSYEMVEMLKNKQSVLGLKDDLICIDHNSSGVALASTLRNVPFITVKVAENRINQENNLDTYLKVLDKYVDLGKAVISMINDIGRNDILEGKDFYE